MAYFLKTSDRAADLMSEILQDALYGDNEGIALHHTDFMLVDVAETILSLERLDGETHRFVIISNVSIDTADTRLMMRTYKRAIESEHDVIIYDVWRGIDDYYTVERITD